MSHSRLGVWREGRLRALMEEAAHGALYGIDENSLLSGIQNVVMQDAAAAHRDARDARGCRRRALLHHRAEPIEERLAWHLPSTWAVSRHGRFPLEGGILACPRGGAVATALA